MPSRQALVARRVARRFYRLAGRVRDRRQARPSRALSFTRMIAGKSWQRKATGGKGKLEYQDPQKWKNASRTSAYICAVSVPERPLDLHVRERHDQCQTLAHPTPRSPSLRPRASRTWRSGASARSRASYPGDEDINGPFELRPINSVDPRLRQLKNGVT